MSARKKNKPLNVLYVSRGLLKGAGYRTRVLSEMEAIASQRINSMRKVKAMLLDFEERLYWDEREIETIRNNLGSLGIKSYFLRIGNSHLNALVYRLLARVFESFLESVVIVAIVLREKIKVIHAQSYSPTLTCIAASKALHVPLVLDAHGIVEEKSTSDNRLSIKGKGLKFLERICIRNSWHLFVVSEAMKAHFGLSDTSKASIVPCAVNTNLFKYDKGERSETLKDLVLDGKFVVVYSGSFFGPWQQPDKMLEVYMHIKARIQNSILLILTTDEVTDVSKFLVSRGLSEDCFEIRRLDHRDVPKHLLAGDIGLLIRAQDTINRVACPTKFGEYLACGIPVLCTDGIGDISAYVKKHKIGIVLGNEWDCIDWDLICKDIVMLKDSDIKRKCREIALQLFSWESQAVTLINSYIELDELSSKKPV